MAKPVAFCITYEKHDLGMYGSQSIAMKAEFQHIVGLSVEIEIAHGDVA